ncbi:MAG: hypothetical protein IPM46_02815 [Flavobacteriales bacterium]|nr:hypothetical protein [Flavobacteriales bacterium]
MMRTTTTLALGLILHAIICAQGRNSIDLRHATGNGPFPVYLALQIAHSSNQQAFERLATPTTERFGGRDGRVRMWGPEVSIGAIHNTESFLWIRGWRVHSTSMEAGYKFLARNFTDGQGRYLNLRQGLLSVRYGRRHNVYYPITIHWQVGPVLLHDMRVDVRDPLKGGLVASAGVRTQTLGILGAEARARIVFFDPVGAAGGFSLFFEGQYIYLREPPGMRVLGAVTAQDGYAGGRLHMGVFSFGTTIPLALRIR